jgi:hypothetical protein
MPDTTDGDRRRRRRESWRRLGWFVVLYAAGLAVSLGVAGALRALIVGDR